MKKWWGIISVLFFLLTSIFLFLVSDKTNTLKLIRTLDDYLAEYEALCNQKQVSEDGQE